MFKKYLVLISLLFNLVSCTYLKPLPPPTVTHYTISAIAKPQLAKAYTPQTLYVSAMLASAGYNTSDMLYTDETYTVKSFTRNRWLAPPAQLLTPLLVQSLQNMRYFKAVISGASDVNTDWQLDSQLLLLQQVFSAQQTEVHLQLRVQLFDVKHQRIIATKLIDCTEPAPSANPAGGVIAANHAVTTAFTQINQFMMSLK